MAAGSHLEKGIWALLVMAAIMISKIVALDDGVNHIFVIFQWPWFSVHAMEIRSITSPIRLVRAVIMPAARDLGFW